MTRPHDNTDALRAAVREKSAELPAARRPKRKRLNPPPTTWYCVIRISDLAIVYHGCKESKARSRHTEDTKLALGGTYGESEVRAAIAAGKARQGLGLRS